MIKTFYVGVKGFIVQGDKVLLLHKAGGNFWEAPGGRIDGDETIEEALDRELHEEVPNIKDIRIGDIVGAHRLPKDIDGDKSLTLIYYLVSAGFDGDPQISDEHDNWQWASKDEVMKLLVEKEQLVKAVFSKVK